MEPELILDYTLLWPTPEKRGEGNLDYHEGLCELGRAKAYAVVEQEQGRAGLSTVDSRLLRGR